MELASQTTGIPVHIDWQPFYLNHNTPEEGEGMYEHLAAKYGVAKARALRSQIIHSIKQAQRWASPSTQPAASSELETRTGWSSGARRWRPPRRML